ncbi:MAG: hypothetical protein HQ568_08445 [Calditrichaeota bacterium]|nr:hypothetical protein [Calditrichota bacterium]
MELVIISRFLKARATDLDIVVPGLKWYIFGSLLNDNKHHNDVDVLVIYRNTSDPEIIKAHLKDLSLLLPLDLVFMTAEEENELHFIETQKTTQIFPPNNL